MCVCVCVCVCACVRACVCGTLGLADHLPPVHSCHASEERVRSGIKKLTKGLQGATQGRLDSFFKVMPAPAKAVKRPVRSC